MRLTLDQKTDGARPRESFGAEKPPDFANIKVKYSLYPLRDTLRIAVPPQRHDNFYNDPIRARPVWGPSLLESVLFSQTADRGIEASVLQSEVTTARNCVALKHAIAKIIATTIG